MRGSDVVGQLGRDMAVEDAVDHDRAVGAAEQQRCRAVFLPSLDIETGIEGELDDLGFPTLVVDREQPHVGQRDHAVGVVEPALDEPLDPLAVTKQHAEDAEGPLAGSFGVVLEPGCRRSDAVRVVAGWGGA